MGELDGGSNNPHAWHEEGEKSGVIESPDLVDTLVEAELSKSTSLDTGKLVGHNVIFSAATSVPVVGNRPSERVVVGGITQDICIDFSEDRGGDGVDLNLLSWSAGLGGWQLVVVIDWHERERSLGGWKRLVVVHERQRFY